eukprot:3043673-Lingulodinium_polyedra.AAC.1
MAGEGREGLAVPRRRGAHGQSGVQCRSGRAAGHHGGWSCLDRWRVAGQAGLAPPGGLAPGASPASACKSRGALGRKGRLCAEHAPLHAQHLRPPLPVAAALRNPPAVGGAGPRRARRDPRELPGGPLHA